MGDLTRGYVRFSLHIKDSDSLYYSILGDGCCNLCELEVSDTYSTEEKAINALNKLDNQTKANIEIQKVVYEFNKFELNKHMDNEYDDTDYHNYALPYPLCVIEDRYGGAYSGAYFLALNMSPFGVDRLPLAAGDGDCLHFWENEADEYIIGKGKTPEEAVWNLITLLKENKNE